MSSRDPNGPTLCGECLVRTACDDDSRICYQCKVASIGFSFRGGGGYTRESFHDYTIAERRAEILDGRELGVDTEPSSTYGQG